METKNYLEKLREMKSVAFATVDKEGNPQVRIADIMMVKEDKLYFVTARGKEFYEEVIHNKKIAVVGITKEYQTIRVSGKVKKANKKFLEKIFLLNPSINEIYPEKSAQILEVFCLYEGKGEFFDLSAHPVKRDVFKVGTPKNIKIKVFKITNKCVACGKCKKVCPQKCIKKGNPYEIVQENCLHCGNCFEKCPKSAIVKKEKAL